MIKVKSNQAVLLKITEAVSDRTQTHDRQVSRPPYVYVVREFKFHALVSVSVSQPLSTLDVLILPLALSSHVCRLSN